MGEADNMVSGGFLDTVCGEGAGHNCGNARWFKRVSQSECERGNRK